MQMSIQFKVVGLVAGPKGARSSLCALSDITQANTVLEDGRNASDTTDLLYSATILLERLV